MNSLKEKFQTLKEAVLIKEKKDRASQEKINRILGEIFKKQKNYQKYLNAVYFKSSQLVIETKSKTFANEIFVHKEELINKLKKFHPLTQLIIK